MECYDQLGTIGEGTYGVVLKARHRESQQVVAIKKFKESDEDEQVRKTALREVRILKQLRHENVVSLIEVFRRKRKLYLVFEYVEGNLLEALEKHPEGLETGEVRRIMWQLIRGVDYLHSHSVIHRDLKPENLLLSKLGLLKLCDFGFARFLAGPGARYTDYVSTRWYRCPELLIGDTAYGKPVDMWAIGCLMAELSNGMPLFPGESDVDQLFQIMRCFGNLTPRMVELVRRNPLFNGVKLPEITETDPLDKRLSTLDPMALDVIKQCLRYEPLQRITCAELLRHPYFAGVEEQFGPQYRAALEKDSASNILGKKMQNQKTEILGSPAASSTANAKQHPDASPVQSQTSHMQATALQQQQQQQLQQQAQAAAVALAAASAAAAAAQHQEQQKQQQQALLAQQQQRLQAQAAAAALQQQQQQQQQQQAAAAAAAQAAMQQQRQQAQSQVQQIMQLGSQKQRLDPTLSSTSSSSVALSPHSFAASSPKGSKRPEDDQMNYNYSAMAGNSLQQQSKAGGAGGGLATAGGKLLSDASPTSNASVGLNTMTSIASSSVGRPLAFETSSSSLLSQSQQQQQQQQQQLTLQQQPTHLQQTSPLSLSSHTQMTATNALRGVGGAAQGNSIVNSLSNTKGGGTAVLSNQKSTSSSSLSHTHVNNTNSLMAGIGSSIGSNIGGAGAQPLQSSGLLDYRDARDGAGSVDDRTLGGGSDIDGDDRDDNSSVADAASQVSTQGPNNASATIRKLDRPMNSGSRPLARKSGNVWTGAGSSPLAGANGSPSDGSAPYASALSPTNASDLLPVMASVDGISSSSTLPLQQPSVTPIATRATTPSGLSGGASISSLGGLGGGGSVSSGLYYSQQGGRSSQAGTDLNSYAALMGLDHRVHVDHDVGGGGGIGVTVVSSNHLYSFGSGSTSLNVGLGVLQNNNTSSSSNSNSYLSSALPNPPHQQLQIQQQQQQQQQASYTSTLQAQLNQLKQEPIPTLSSYSQYMQSQKLREEASTQSLSGLGLSGLNSGGSLVLGGKSKANASNAVPTGGSTKANASSFGGSSYGGTGGGGRGGGAAAGTGRGGGGGGGGGDRKEEDSLHSSPLRSGVKPMPAPSTGSTSYGVQQTTGAGAGRKGATRDAGGRGVGDDERDGKASDDDAFFSSRFGGANRRNEAVQQPSSSSSSSSSWMASSTSSSGVVPANANAAAASRKAGVGQGSYRFEHDSKLDDREEAKDSGVNGMSMDLFGSGRGGGGGGGSSTGVPRGGAFSSSDHSSSSIDTSRGVAVSRSSAIPSASSYEAADAVMSLEDTLIGLTARDAKERERVSLRTRGGRDRESSKEDDSRLFTPSSSILSKSEQIGGPGQLQDDSIYDSLRTELASRARDREKDRRGGGGGGDKSQQGSVVSSSQSQQQATVQAGGAQQQTYTRGALLSREGGRGGERDRDRATLQSRGAMTMTGIGSSLTGMSVSTPMGRGSNPYDSGGLDVNQRGGGVGGGGGSSNDRERLMQPATSHGRSSHGGHSYHAPGSSGNGLAYNAPAGAVPTTGLGGHILTQGGVGQSLGARYRSDGAASGQNDGGPGGRAGGGQSQSGVSLSVTALRYKDRGERSERDKLVDSSTYGTRGVSTSTNSNSQFGGPFNQSAYGRSSQGAAAAQASSSMRSQQSQSQQNAQQQAQQQQQANQAAAAQNRYATNPLAAPQGGGGARWTGLSGLSLRGAAAR